MTLTGFLISIQAASSHPARFSACSFPLSTARARLSESNQTLFFSISFETASEFGRSYQAGANWKASASSRICSEPIFAEIHSKHPSRQICLSHPFQKRKKLTSLATSNARLFSEAVGLSKAVVGEEDKRAWLHPHRSTTTKLPPLAVKARLELLQ